MGLEGIPILKLMTSKISLKNNVPLPLWLESLARVNSQIRVRAIKCHKSHVEKGTHILIR